MSYVKIQSNQSTISATNNLIDFDIDEYLGGIDMEKSFININYRIDTTETAGVTGVHNFIKLFKGIGENDEAGLFNSCLFRNIHLSSARVGQLESIQRADLLNQVKQQYTKNVGDILGSTHSSIMNLPNRLTYGMDSSRNLYTEGSQVSVEQEGVMRVDLKDILGLGTYTLNLAQTGTLRLHLDAQLDKFILSEVPTFNGVNIKGGSKKFWAADTSTPIPIGASPTVLTFALDVNAFAQRQNVPYWVGQKVSFVLTSTTARTATEVTITSIVYSTTAEVAGPPIVPAGGRVTISFSGPISDAIVTNPVTAVAMYPVYAATASLVYTGAQLVIKTVEAPPASVGLQYRTYSTIQDHAGATQSFNRTYEIPANATASMVAFDTASNTTEFSNSQLVNLESYQIFVDNEGQTDRRVKIQQAEPFTKDPLHGILTEKCLEEQGLPYKNNLDVVPRQIGGNATALDRAVLSDHSIFDINGRVNGFVTLPVIYKGNGMRKLVNIDVAQAAAAQTDLNLCIYSHLMKSITYQ